jgi:hypothetical protein
VLADSGLVDGEVRRRIRRLAGTLPGGGDADALSPVFARLERDASALARRWPAKLRVLVTNALPAVLHMSANRWLGRDRALEALGYVLWERTLESIAARSRARRGRGQLRP